MKFKNLASLVLAGSLLNGCAIHYKHTPYTKEDKQFVGYYIAGSALDIISTQQTLEEGMMEGNPIYGEAPKIEALVIGKLVGLFIFYILGEISPEDRDWLYGSGATFGVGASLWNNYLIIEKNRK